MDITKDWETKLKKEFSEDDSEKRFENILILDEIKNKVTKLLENYKHIKNPHNIENENLLSDFQKKMDLQVKIMNDFCKKIIWEVYEIEINKEDNKHTVIAKIFKIQIDKNENEISITKKLQDKYVKELLQINNLSEANWFLGEMEASVSEILAIYHSIETEWVNSFSSKFRELWEQDTTKPKEFFEENLYNDIIIPILWKM